MDECWRVRITLEKNIKAGSRGEAKMKLIEETRRSKLDDFDEPETVFDMCPGLIKPFLQDASASKIKRDGE